MERKRGFDVEKERDTKIKGRKWRLKRKKTERKRGFEVEKEGNGDEKRV